WFWLSSAFFRPSEIIASRFSMIFMIGRNKNLRRIKNRMTRLIMVRTRLKSILSTYFYLPFSFELLFRILLLQEEDNQNGNNKSIDRCCLCQCTSKNQGLADLSFCLRLSCDSICCFRCGNTDTDTCSNTCQNCYCCSDCNNCTCHNCLISFSFSLLIIPFLHS